MSILDSIKAVFGDESKAFLKNAEKIIKKVILKKDDFCSIFESKKIVIQ